MAQASQRQDEILRLIAQGLADKEIARRLGLSYSTIRAHLDRFYARHGIHDRSAAVALWLCYGPTATAEPRPSNDSSGGAG